MALRVHILYDPDTDQLVFYTLARDGLPHVELLRLDIQQLGASELDRLSHARDPKRPQPAPGDTPATRR